ncbi:HAD family hydrolase [Proteocatella sphenisci]|uniref:HAD family hydrolase n=1 Tax=Proteocatella sphenisci TaxID=181070 RepID=UPI0004BB9BF8|nr:HAD family hydrolase [Proteocatella sphenisci]
MKGIIFDYDGTLHESIRIYAPAFQRAYEFLVQRGLAPEKEWNYSEIGRWLGYTSKDMWNAFMPGLDEELKQRCSTIIGQTMLEFTGQGKAQLYDGSLETLETLKNRGHKLIFLSNCKTQYMEAHKREFGLDRYFEGFYCTHQYNFAPKHEIFSHILAQHPGTYTVIGDRFQDIEIAQRHGLVSIGCTYGYGELDELRNADFRISDIRELSDILKSRYPLQHLYP